MSPKSIISSVFVSAVALFGAVYAGEADNTDYPYDRTYKGDGTYYDYTSNGHCTIGQPVPAMYQGMIPMAISTAQYGKSWLCGACVEGEGTGRGSGRNPIGKFKGYIHDSCGSCAEGDLDFMMDGDGRWDIEWKFVPCDGGVPDFVFQGSNPWYWKIQARGTISPVEELWVNRKPATRVADNFFEITDGAPFKDEQVVEVKTILGGYYKKEVEL